MSHILPRLTAPACAIPIRSCGAVQAFVHLHAWHLRKDSLWRANTIVLQCAQTFQQKRSVGKNKHTHTHAKNCHCESCCGMHRTCKNNSVTPDRNVLVKGPEKYREVTIVVARSRCNKVEADPSLPTKPNRSHLDKKRQQCKPENENKF